MSEYERIQFLGYAPLPGRQGEESYAHGDKYEFQELAHGIRIVCKQTRAWEVVGWGAIKCARGKGAWPQEVLEFNPGVRKARP